MCCAVFISLMNSANQLTNQNTVTCSFLDIRQKYHIILLKCDLQAHNSATKTPVYFIGDLQMLNIGITA